MSTSPPLTLSPSVINVKTIRILLIKSVCIAYLTWQCKGIQLIVRMYDARLESLSLFGNVNKTTYYINPNISRIFTTCANHKSRYDQTGNNQWLRSRRWVKEHLGTKKLCGPVGGVVCTSLTNCFSATFGWLDDLGLPI